jgi:hypothetical protein
MANRAGNYLFHWRLTPCQPGRIVFSGQVADECGDAATTGAQSRQRLFQQSGFARARTRDETDDIDSGCFEAPSERSRQDVVLLQNVLSDFNQPRLYAHYANSRFFRRQKRPTS